MYVEGFASKLKKARENTGFTQEQISAETGIKRSTIASYEMGRTQPDIERLCTLAEFYCVSTDWLFGIGAANNIKFDGIPREKNRQLSEKSVFNQQQQMHINFGGT